MAVDTPDTGAGTPPEWIDLAADIRAVDGNHDLGAGSLAAALTARGWTRRPAADPAGLDGAVRTLDALTSRNVFPTDKLSARELTVFQMTVGHIKRRLARLSVVDGPGPEERPELLCATCGHGQGQHSSFGMCNGGGTECYCVRFPDAPDFAALSRPLPENREEPSR